MALSAKKLARKRDGHKTRRLARKGRRTPTSVSAPVSEKAKGGIFSAIRSIPRWFTSGNQGGFFLMPAGRTPKEAQTTTTSFQEQVDAFFSGHYASSKLAMPGGQTVEARDLAAYYDELRHAPTMPRTPSKLEKAAVKTLRVVIRIPAFATAIAKKIIVNLWNNKGTIAAGAGANLSVKGVALMFGLSASVVTVPVGAAAIAATFGTAMIVGGAAGVATQFARNLYNHKVKSEALKKGWKKEAITKGLFYGALAGVGCGVLVSNWDNIATFATDHGCPAVGSAMHVAQSTVKETLQNAGSKSVLFFKSLYAAAKPVLNEMGPTLLGMQNVSVKGMESILGLVLGFVSAKPVSSALSVAGKDVLSSSSLFGAAKKLGHSVLTPAGSVQALSPTTVMGQAMTDYTPVNPKILETFGKPLSPMEALQDHAAPTPEKLFGPLSKPLSPMEALQDHAAPAPEKLFDVPVVEIIPVPKTFAKMIPQEVFDTLPKKVKDACVVAAKGTTDMGMMSLLSDMGFYANNPGHGIKATKAARAAAFAMWKAAGQIALDNGWSGTELGQGINANIGWLLMQKKDYALAYAHALIGKGTTTGRQVLEHIMKVAPEVVKDATAKVNHFAPALAL